MAKNHSRKKCPLFSTIFQQGPCSQTMFLKKSGEFPPTTVGLSAGETHFFM